MPLEIDLTHPESQSWLADNGPTRYSRLGEPLSEDVVKRGIRAKVKQNIEALLESREDDFVAEPLQGEFTAGIRSQVANEVLAYLVERDFDIVQFYKNVIEDIKENEDIDGSELLTTAQEQTATLLLADEIPEVELFHLEERVVNRHQNPVAQTIEDLEESDREEREDLQYSYAMNHSSLRIEHTG